LLFNIRAIADRLVAMLDIQEMRERAPADASAEFVLMLALIIFDYYLPFPSADERHARS
jgi:hypothetical protein